MVSKVIYFAVVFLFFAACSGAQGRADDATPLAQDVPVRATTSDSTEAGDAQPPAADGNHIEAALPEGVVINFTVTGGIAGFCDELTVYRDGSYTLTRLCNQEQTSGVLDQNDLNSVEAWAENLADFQYTFEDNPGGPDNMVTHLIFQGQGETVANETQKQIIFDWVNGLMVRLNSVPVEVPPTPEPAAVNPDGLCPTISRPALLTADFENPNLLFFIDPVGQTTCEVTLSRLPAGRIATAAGDIYYPVFDPDTEAVIVLQLKANGEQIPLPFTQVSAQEEGPSDFVVSSDGTRIAWSETTIDSESEPPLYRNSLWLANTDGTNQVAIMDQVENEEIRFVAPIRFATDNETLYYAMQPDVPGIAFSGRLDTMYKIAAGDEEPQLVYDCSSEAANAFCINGLSPDGQTLTIIDPATDSLQIVDQAGQVINSIAFPATDYIERTAFAPNGNLAFVSATLTETDDETTPPLPDPAYITFLAAPYTGDPETLLSNNTIGTLWGWLDDERLVYGVFGAEGATSTALLTLEGETTEVSPYIAVGVLR